MSLFEDLTGQRFGRLLALSPIRQPGKRTKFLCQCDCGEQSIVMSTNLKRGVTKSCGCLQKERAAAAKTKHGHTRRSKGSTSTYNSWLGMKARCNNPGSPSYEDYGDKGIGYCKSWESFENFLEDMGERPDGKTLHRLNNDHGYDKANCVWADWATQGKYKSTTRWITIDGQTDTLTGWGRRMGVNYTTIQGRLNRGWNEKDAVFTPVRGRR